MGILSTLTGVRAATGSASSITLSFSDLTGADCLLVVKGVSSNAMDVGSLSATWQGGAVPIIVEGQDGELHAQIAILVLGDLEEESGDVVLSKTMDDDTAMGCEATVYDDFQQGVSVRDFDSAAPGSNDRSIAVTLDGLLVGDVCVSAAIIPDDGWSIAPDQPAVVVWDPLGGGGVDDASGGTSTIIATGPTQEKRWEWGIPRTRAIAAVALIPTKPIKGAVLGFVGVTRCHRVTVGGVGMDPGGPGFVGTVDTQEVPGPGPVSVTDSAPALSSVVPEPSLAPGAVSLLGGAPGFVGAAGVPQLDLTMFQGPGDFAGTVPEPEVSPGSIDLEQVTLTNVGIVPADHGFTVGSSPDIEQAPNTFAGTVPTQDLLYLVGQLDTPFVGAVPAPTVVEGESPDIRQPPFVPEGPEGPVTHSHGDDREFVGIVGTPNVTMGLEQQPAGFAGVVPRPFSVILRDPDGRKHISLGLGA